MDSPDSCAEVSTKIFTKYYDYIDIFSFNIVIELSKNTSVNKYVIGLIEDKQPLYSSIYTFSLIELEILKTYIIIHLKIGFI